MHQESIPANYYCLNKRLSLGRAAPDVCRLLTTFHGLIFRDVPEDPAVEKTAMRRLRVDLRQATPYRRIKHFLSALEQTAQSLQLKMVSRNYRSTFTRNYRALMPVDRRLYRIDVLESGQDNHGALWVNGERFELSGEVIKENSRFQDTWFALLERLREVQSKLDQSQNKKTICWNCRDDNNNTINHSAQDPSSICQYCEIDWLPQLGPIMLQFDKSWTNFERTYITELITIERKARRVVMDVIHIDEELQLYEDCYHRILKTESSDASMTSPRRNNKKVETTTLPALESANLIHMVYVRFVDAIAALNAAANVKGKGRQDYSFDLLHTALTIVHEAAIRKNQRERKNSWVNARQQRTDNWISRLTEKEIQCLLPIAEPLMHELTAFRSHIQQLSEAPERIDPHLMQNQELVSHLAQLEVEWDIATRWLGSQDQALSIAKFISFVSEIADIDYWAPSARSTKRFRRNNGPTSPHEDTSAFESFEERIAALDVGVFLALPRLAVIFFINCPWPESHNYYLFSKLLPGILSTDDHPSSKQPPFSGCDLAAVHRSGCRDLLDGKQFFGHLQSLAAHVNKIPQVIRTIILRGDRIASLCQSACRANEIREKKTCSFELRTFHHILERLTADTSGDLLTQLPAIPGLSERVDRFYNAIEELSISLQRSHPEDWNGFVHVVIRCLQSLRSTTPRRRELSLVKSVSSAKGKLEDKNNGTTTTSSPQSSSEEEEDRLFEGSPNSDQRRRQIYRE